MMKYNTLDQIKQYYTAWRATNAIYEDWAKKYGLSYYELLVLLSLGEGKEPCTQKRICEQWTLPKQTVHSILRNFLERGWVSFHVLEDDKRNKGIAFTPAGSAFAGEVIDKLQSLECRVWERLGEEKGNALLESTMLYVSYFREENSCLRTDRGEEG